MRANVDLGYATVALLGPRRLTQRLRGTYQRAAAGVVEFGRPDDLSEESLRGVGFAVVALPAADANSQSNADADAGWHRALAAAGAALPVAVERVAETTSGSITLVGGGPGDPGLITAAGLDALAHADVIFADRLAPEVTHELAPGVRVVPVGKRPGHHPVAQSEIQAQMIQAALSGETVVRLKGGDPFVFGRGGEELVACREAGVDVHVIPGITSAVAVPEHAGIPVTFRELSRSFTVVSGHDPLGERELEHLAGLSRSGATIVLLMGVATLPQTVSGLTRHGLAGDTPLAVLEKGFSPDERNTFTTLATAVVDTAGCASPAVTVIGPVVDALTRGTRTGPTGPGSGSVARS
ncbi:uroporphyrinogen-III C-methyltransferase [Kocuria sp. cx-455]|uniref:uroporphyrinogen-III C-methyltransferase n=1 Tax=Kocuria sp. cx-455 TaxID=2771377 RepID=UPI001685BC88|nr:uroporphyrinogen-III C-methyltransferase [Kocuria sp. cx-455]MBD2765241.1 uroporphyrinogen-III C-methyltransferase [Kocuria sp. cx-455]